MKKVFKFVVELEVDCNDPNDDLDDLSLNVCHGIGKYVMKGVIKNDLCWEFDKDHLVKKVVSSPLSGDIYDKYGRQDSRSSYRYEEEVRNRKLESIL